MIEPKEITLESEDSVSKTYVISLVPYWDSREIAVNYIPSAIPKMGDYQLNESLVLKLFKHVSVITETGTQIQLTTKDLIQNHIPRIQIGIELEAAMLEYNYGFLIRGKILSFFETIKAKLPEWTTKILTALAAQSSTQEKQP